jgi:hypothetical protein
VTRRRSWGRREKCRKDPRNLFKFWRETATLQRQAGRPTTPSGGIRKESSAATSGDGTVGFYSLGPLQPRGASFKQSQSGGRATTVVILLRPVRSLSLVVAQRCAGLICFWIRFVSSLSVSRYARFMMNLATSEFDLITRAQVSTSRTSSCAAALRSISTSTGRGGRPHRIPAAPPGTAQ